MCKEHTDEKAYPDTSREFTTKNYEITTTSRLEWNFVAANDTEPEAGWPVEKKLPGYSQIAEEHPSEAGGWDLTRATRRVQFINSERQKRKRQMLHRNALERLARERAAELRKRNESPLKIEEAMGARLYTGPMFVKCSPALGTILPLQQACPAVPLPHIIQLHSQITESCAVL